MGAKITHYIETGHIDPPITQGAETLKTLMPKLAHYQSVLKVDIVKSQ